MEEDIGNNMHYEEKVAKWVCDKCKKCNSRKKRMHDHVALCLGYKLYLCDKSYCGFDNWYESFSFDPFWQISTANECISVVLENSKPNRTEGIIEIPVGKNV